MKIEQSTEINTKKAPDGTRKDGIRLDAMLDALTTMRAAGVPDGASIRIEGHGGDYNRIVVAHWTENR
jgi:hypothetical protein